MHLNGLRYLQSSNTCSYTTNKNASSDDGLTLKTSDFRIFVQWSIYIINSTNISWNFLISSVTIIHLISFQRFKFHFIYIILTTSISKWWQTNLCPVCITQFDYPLFNIPVMYLHVRQNNNGNRNTFKPETNFDHNNVHHSHYFLS